MKERRLYINRETMNIKSLEILIKHGLDMEDELLGPLRRALTELHYEKRRDQEKDETNKDIDIISSFAKKKLRDSYRYLSFIIVICLKN